MRLRNFLRSRLEQIRAQLQRSSIDTRIIDVMMSYGITHGGKFAKEYRQLFGEKPSDTLRQANQSDRQDRPLWHEIDDLHSERIAGGLVRENLCQTDDRPGLRHGYRSPRKFNVKPWLVGRGIKVFVDVFLTK